MAQEGSFLGAVASSAGDDFHEQWVARQLLRLLDPGGEILSIKVEGVPADVVHAELGEHAQAVDVTLTSGADEARCYRYLQLKYSPSHPDGAWTWARLTRPKAKTRKYSSVLGKLARLMREVGFAGDFEIVTNQPLDPAVTSDITILLSNGDQLPDDPPAIAKTLMTRLGLNESELVRFLRAWDLGGFASVSRLQLHTEVVRRLAETTDADAREDAKLLQNHIKQLMLPEGQRSGELTRESILVWLGAGANEIFFPAPSGISAPDPLLRRPIAISLATLLQSPLDRPVRVRADGGCGKTSLISTIEDTLPAGSEVLVYDSYGGGMFLASDQRRHLPEHAFTQIGNELAARLCTPFVIRRNESLSAFGAFRRRVTAASEIIAARNADALLVLCFDAVDNARIGARHWVEPCFLDELAAASGWPTNVRVVVSCRNARLDDVGAAELYFDFPVPTFDERESQALVALWQPAWSQAIAGTLHDLTGGNPRRLVYAIEGLGAGEERLAVARLLPRATGIDPLFAKRVEEAGVRIGGPSRIWPMLSALARLPRPIPADSLAAIANLDAADLIDVANDVGGIVLHPNGWSFHDEDFEAFVDERTKDGATDLLNHAADILTARSLTDRYAALALGEVLVSAGQLEQLYALVTGRDPLPPAMSAAEAEFVRSRRLSLALRACQRAADIGTACGLLIASAEATKRQKILDDLLADNLDLSVRFEPDAAMRLVMTGRRHRKRRARFRIELAASLAGDDPTAARGHYRWWQEHLHDNWASSEADRQIDISSADIAADVRTHAIIAGDTAGLTRIQQWRPIENLAPVFQQLAQDAAGLRPDALREAIAARVWPPRALAPLVAAALLAGCSFGEPILRDALARLARASAARWAKPIDYHATRSPSLSWHEALLLVCERAAADPAHHAAIGSILARAFPMPVLTETHDLFRLRTAGALHARVLALTELIRGQRLVLGDWLPPVRVVPKDTRPAAERFAASQSGRRERSDEEYWNETRADTLDVFGRMLKAARVTRDLVTGRIAPDQASAHFSAAFNYPRSHGARPRETDAAALLMRSHLFHAGLAGVDLAALRTSATGSLKSWYAAGDNNLLDLAEALVLMPSGHDAALAWLVAIAQDIETDAGAASERAKLLAKCARAALPLDPALSATFFASALACTREIDFEALAEVAACRAVAEAGLGGDRTARMDLARRVGDAAGAVVATLDLQGDFAWDGVARAVAAADLPTGLAAISRWHDVGLARFEITLPGLLTASVARQLSPAQRYALALLSDSSRPQMSQMFGDDLVPEAVFAAEVQDRLLSGDFVEFTDTLNELSQLTGAGASAALAVAEAQRQQILALRPQSPGAPADDEDEWDTHATEPQTPLNTVAEVSEALEVVRTAEHSVGERVYLDIAGRVRTRTLRVPFLDLALAVAGDKGDFGMALPELLASWSDYPPVRIWAAERIGGYVALALRNLFEWQYEDTAALEALLESTGVPPAAQAIIVLEAIAYNAETISAELIFALVGVIAARSPADTRNALLDTLLERVTARAGRPAQMPLGDINVPDDHDQAVARCLFAAMADVDKRIRWRASHAALLLIQVDDPTVPALIGQLAATGERSFIGADFYLYAAREQLMTVLWRTAISVPHIVGRFAPDILLCLRSDPHLIVRELGRSTLRDLASAGAITLTSADATYVANLNRSQFAPAPEQGRSLRAAAFHEEKKKRAFHFDTMDTIRYWYQPPAALFGLDMESFLDRIERWIHGRWGYGEETSHWLKEPRLNRIQDEERHVSNRQGHRPMVERLSHYLEWHGMMCAMGELIEVKPLVERNRYGDDYLEWLSRSLPTIGPSWLSDLRTPAPFQPRCWGHPPAGDVAEPERDERRARDPWLHSVTAEVFDQEVDVGGGNLVVAANYELRWRDRVQPVDVRTALVTPETAMALGQALLTAHDRMDFLVPGTGDDGAIEEKGFELEGWLRYVERDARSDRHDLRRGSVSGLPILPDGRSAQAMNLKFDGATSRWHGTGNLPAIDLAMWGDDDARNGAGWRATASRRFLHSMLVHADKSLLIYSEIARRRPHGDGGKTRWALYILDQQDHLHRVRRVKRGLGPWMIKRERMQLSVDTLGRWLLHRAAELDALRANAAQGEAVRLEGEIARLCERFRKNHGRWHER